VWYATLTHHVVPGAMLARAKRTQRPLLARRAIWERIECGRPAIGASCQHGGYHTTKVNTMQLQSILNRVQKQRGFVDDQAHFVERGGKLRLVVAVRERRGCSHVFGVLLQASGLRQDSRAPISGRTTIGDPGVLCVRTDTLQLSLMWCTQWSCCGGFPASNVYHVSRLVPRELGEGSELEGNAARFCVSWQSVFTAVESAVT
jgi:hypothetical protein